MDWIIFIAAGLYLLSVGIVVRLLFGRGPINSAVTLFIALTWPFWLIYYGIDKLRGRVA